jgi:DNA (cytosine-5)-methyltransferase 1
MNMTLVEPRMKHRDPAQQSPNVARQSLLPYSRRSGTPTVISLFSGAGGFDLGLEAAGFEVRVAIDSDKAACDTLRANRGKTWRVCETDIRDLPSEAICEVSGLAPEEPSLLAGGPPCQPFSKAAFWRHGDTRRLADPRADTLSAYLRVLRDLRPKAYILENVSGLMFRGKDEGLRLLRRAIEAINAETGTSYSFSVLKLNAADYGVPQIRERVFIVGARDGAQFRRPDATHAETASRSEVARANDGQSEPWRTAWDAIGDLNDFDDSSLKVGGQWGDLLPSIPDGENYLWHTDRGGGMPLFGWRRRYWSFLLKLAKDRPAWTVQAQPGTAIGPFHWRSRRLSTRELCRIQTFPDAYEIVGGRSDVQRQLGNAVPSLLAEVLGREIRHQLFDDRIRNGKLKFAVALRGKPPKPERRRKVPKKYHAYVGTHTAHPGTGRGYAFHGR